jgi:antirestriction protein
MIALATPSVTLSTEVQALFDELKEQNFHDEDMRNFIEFYGQQAFVEHYEMYVELGEIHSYDAVEAFIQEFDIDSLPQFEDAYFGQYDSEEQFVESYIDDNSGVAEIAPWVVIDYTGTWESSLKYDFTFTSGHVFNRNF